MEKEASKNDRLIHCITNPISMNQCANAILALGARPIMAEHPDEVMEITRTASSLLLNLGNITDSRISSMRLALKEASATGIPVTLDAVGAACSSLRKTLVRLFLTSGKFACLKGNYSEILALYDDTYKAAGVDAKEGIESELIRRAVIELSKTNNCIVAATGKVDLIASDGEIKEVTGGSAQLSQVTGTGCMLGAIIATYLAEENSFQSVVNACKFFKSCGEKAATDKGTGTFMVNLLDAIGVLHES
ncbi:MAG: hydroxyethylthiazole kinase [Saccharofermentans sp.]|nr:hydroxyethylthiazole kinase [Saccharofermentans sp.]